MERVLDHDLRCESLGFSVMIRRAAHGPETSSRRVCVIKSCVCRPGGLLLCQLNPLVSRGPIGKLNGLVHALKLSLITRIALHCAHRLESIFIQLLMMLKQRANSTGSPVAGHPDKGSIVGSIPARLISNYICCEPTG
jgi:hypothetical protein